jgi:putative flippase GtrA
MLKKIFTPFLIKFIIVGFSNMIIGYIVFTVFYNSILTGLAFPSQCVSYGSGIFWSFFWNKNWTFSEKNKSWSAFFPFLVLQITLLILSATLISIAADNLSWDINIIWFLIMALITLINFTFSKYMVFRT